MGSVLNRRISVVYFYMLLLTAQVPTLGSQEGAFENVRMNYSGDQGQTIRQLISAHVLRRVAMCVLSSPHGRRQHLAVSHEKGKVSSLTLYRMLECKGKRNNLRALNNKQHMICSSCPEIWIFCKVLHSLEKPLILQRKEFLQQKQ